MPYNEQGKSIITATKAHTDLNVFAAVMVLMEGSLISSDCFTAAARIIKICKAEQRKCLVRYDRAIKKAGGGTYGR